MTAFRIHPTDDSLRADDVDVRRVAKKLSTLIQELAHPAPRESDAWPIDKWMIKATQLLGAENLHAAQAEAMSQDDYLRRLSPMERAAVESRLQRREVLHKGLINSREEAYLNSLFSPAFCKQFPPMWRNIALDALRADRMDRLNGGRQARADVVVGTGSAEIVTAAITSRGEHGILIDLAQDGALSKLAAWQQVDRGMLSTTVGFLGLSRVIARGGAPTALLSHIAQFALLDRRAVIVFDLENADLPVFLEPAPGLPHFDSVSVHHLDKLFDELQWSKHHDLRVTQPLG
ncbi:hypothetical protein CE206_28785 (plasmid) [Achromobacter xylosoxidans]|uniref:hypothetical protein n=1 Tax=Alcaligenes xylosoxydans xylosoxydans TaxID=85698 RepID=UPI000DD101B0|nr:hypothetical protein [Achromobacter xylosoxidans]AXA80576.1 hypothetical protein CE206_28785 [Achromobacter xylosoxidans]